MWHAGNAAWPEGQSCTVEVVESAKSAMLANSKAFQAKPNVTIAKLVLIKIKSIWLIVSNVFQGSTKTKWPNTSAKIVMLVNIKSILIRPNA